MPGAPLSIFISYSRADSGFVDQLEARLKARGFDTWVDRSKLVGGDLWLKEVQKQVDRCQVWLCKSPRWPAVPACPREQQFPV